MPKIRKRTTKRTTLKQKYKVIKKVNEHKRKVRKQSNKMKALGQKPKRMKKDMGVPNIFPFKEELINQLERKEKLDEQQRELLKNMTKEQKSKQTGSIASYALAVQAKVEKYEEDERFGLTEEEIKEAENLLDPNLKQMAQSRKAYIRELRKVIEAADVICEVIDARDPQGCRSLDLEREIIGGGKKLVLILNKIDLVPPENARVWQKSLRREFPTVLFKATKQSQNNNLAGSTALHKSSMTDKSEMVEEMLSSAKAIGTDALLGILKNYARVDGSHSTKQQITVGIIGFPNVGKSSLINSLKRSKAAAVGNTPGITKAMQEIQLDKNIILLDSPGVVLATQDQSDALILRSAIKVEELKDPFKPMNAILGRVNKEELLRVYRIADFATPEEFIGNIARKKGLLQSGGIPNTDQAARSVIRDFLNGKLKYFTVPPAQGFDDDDDIEMNADA